MWGGCDLSTRLHYVFTKDKPLSVMFKNQKRLLSICVISVAEKHKKFNNDPLKDNLSWNPKHDVLLGNLVISCLPGHS